MALTKEQAVEVYRLATETDLKPTRIGAQFGCDEATVREIKSKQRWKDATDEYDAKLAAECAAPAVAAPSPDPLTRPDAFTADDGRRDLFPDTLPPPKRRRMNEQRRKRVTDADRPVRPVVPDGLDAAGVRALLAAKRFGVARVAGGYGGRVSIDPAGVMATFPDEELVEAFVTERAVVAQVKRGLLAPGEHANTFVLTDAGLAKLKEYDAFLDAMDAWRSACITYMNDKRAQQARERHAKGKGKAA